MNDDIMNIKIQNSGKNGSTNTKGTSRNLAEYLEHEDKERREKGLTVFPFVKADGTPIPKEEVIDKIDRNNKRLSKSDYKFYHLVVAMSKAENLALGKTDEEVFDNALTLIRAISDAYAANFHKAGVDDGDDLEIYWKPHFTRGENDELQFHLHAIVSHRAKGNGPKLSPLTAHRNTQNGPALGGFNRNAFASRCEKIFDELTSYDRQVAESFAYQNAMAHGTAQEKAQQAERLARENEAALRAELEESLAKRRKRKRLEAMENEIAETIPDEAVEIASLTSGIQQCFATSSERLFLDLNLAAMGLSCSAEMAQEGGVKDLLFLFRGQSFKASEYFSNAQLTVLLDRWEAFTGEEPAHKVKAREAAWLKEEKNRKLKQALTPENAPRRGLHL